MGTISQPSTSLRTSLAFACLLLTPLLRHTFLYIVGAYVQKTLRHGVTASSFCPLRPTLRSYYGEEQWCVREGGACKRKICRTLVHLPA